MKINENALKFIFEEELYRSPVLIHSKIDSSTPFIGANNKNILILVPTSGSSEVIQANILEFLSKILNSIGLTIDDVVITDNKNQEKWDQLKNDFSPQKILFFGIKPFEIGIESLDINTYEVKPFQGNFILYADKLEDIKEDLNKKKALWVNLKKLFT